MNAKPTPALRVSPLKVAAPPHQDVLPSDQGATRAENRVPITDTLARFAADTAHDAIPAAVRARALHHMLDAAGIAVATTRYDHAHRVLTAMTGLGGGSGGTVPLFGFPGRLAPRDAAIVNGYLCHGLDFDDTHVAGIVHPTASVLPAVLSTAAHVGASGQAMVTAFVIGIETAARLGMVAKGGFHQVGFHPTGMIGVFGCALAAGRLMGLNADQLAMAQGIALSLAAGSLEFVEDGAWNKRLHPGWAAQAGMTAAALAREGFVGATRPYDGRFGLFNSYLGTHKEQADYALATAGLGAAWELLQVAIKPYPACHFTHACIDSALLLRAEGVRPERIRAIEVQVPEGVFKTVCLPEANKLNPANSYDAQFSVQWLTACAFVNGRFGLAELMDDRIADPAVMALTQKVTFADFPESPFPKAYSGGVTVTLDDGRVLRHREPVNRGAADRPLANEEIIAKFRANAATAFNGDVVARMEAAMLGLDTAERGAERLAAFSA
jgi:2-methylcitrate dehydratase PrpD